MIAPSGEVPSEPLTTIDALTLAESTTTFYLTRETLARGSLA
jgi:hypothetical protein